MPQEYTEIQRQGLMDAQHDNEALPAFTVQLFTAPTVARVLQEKDDVLKVILETMLSQLEAMLGPDRILDCERECDIVESGRITWLANDVCYILRCQPERVMSALPPFLQLLSQMQGMNPHRHAARVHVEFEDRGWVRALTLLLNLSDMLELVRNSLVKTVRAGEWCSDVLLHCGKVRQGGVAL